VEESTFRGELDESPVAEIDDTRRIQTIRLIRRRITSETLHGHGDDRRVARAKTRTRKACSHATTRMRKFSSRSYDDELRARTARHYEIRLFDIV